MLHLLDYEIPCLDDCESVHWTDYISIDLVENIPTNQNQTVIWIIGGILSTIGRYVCVDCVLISGVYTMESMDKLTMNVIPLIFHLICLHAPAFLLLFYFSHDSVRDSFDQLFSLNLYIDVKCNRKHFNYTGNVNKIIPLIIFTLHLEANIHISIWSRHLLSLAHCCVMLTFIWINSGKWETEQKTTSNKLFENLEFEWWALLLIELCHYVHVTEQRTFGMFKHRNAGTKHSSLRIADTITLGRSHTRAHGNPNLSNFVLTFN